MTDTFLITKLNIKGGRIREFSEAMEKVVPMMEEQGWKLLNSFFNILGDLHEVIDIWQIPDANSVAQARLGVRDNPAYREAAPILREVVESETLSLCHKTTFSP